MFLNGDNESNDRRHPLVYKSLHIFAIITKFLQFVVKAADTYMGSRDVSRLFRKINTDKYENRPNLDLVVYKKS